MRGKGASATADSWTSSKNFMKSLSDIFLADDFSALIAEVFWVFFFSGVAGVASFFGVVGFLGVGGFGVVIFFGVGGLADSLTCDTAFDLEALGAGVFFVCEADAVGSFLTVAGVLDVAALFSA